MPDLEVKPAKVKKEDSDSGKYKSVLEKSSQKDNSKNNISKENISQEDVIQIKSLLSDNITEEKFSAEVEKITDKGTLIKAVNSVVDLYIKYGKKQYIDYKFKVLIKRFKTLFNVEECDKCFEDTFEKIKHHNDLRSISEDYNFDYDLVDKPKNRKKWWSFGKNKKSKEKKNKDKGFKSTGGSFVSHNGQRRKFNKTKKAQAKGKGNWRLVAKHTFSVSGTALLCGVLNFISQPLGGILSLLTAGISGALIYRDVKNKSKYRKKISNRIGSTIDKLEETNDKYNTKKMENELSKFEKEEKKLDSSSKKDDKDDKVKNQQNQTANQNQQNQTVNQNQQNQTVNQNQQNPMMQNQMMQNQNQQNPMMQQMMQNQMMQDPVIQQYMQIQLWQQMAQNPMMQQMMQNPIMQQQVVNQLWQQMMQNPMMQQYVQNKITNQFLQFQQIGTQNQQVAQTQPLVQQNTTQPQTAQTHTQKLQQQTTTNGTEVSM